MDKSQEAIGDKAIEEISRVSLDAKPIAVTSSLAARILRIALTLYFVVAVAVTLVQLTLEYGHEKERLNSEVLHMLDTFEPILAQGFWNLDDEQMISTSYGILSNDFIFGVRVLEVGGAEMLAVGQIQRPGEPVIKVDASESSAAFSETGLISDGGSPISPDLYSYERVVYYKRALGGEEEVGRVIVFSSPDIVLERALYTFFITMVNAVVKTFFLWVISLIVLNRLVGKPLEAIADAMQRLDLDERRSRELTSELSSRGLIDRPDELGVLVRTFIAMQQALSKKNTQLSNYHRELENKVEERTEKLERAVKAKSEFLANMSHEIRTPMNGVLGMTELLNDTDMSDEQQRYVKTILSSGQVLLSIINDVLDYSKIEAGMMDIESACFDVEELVDDIVRMFAFRSAETGVELTEMIEPGTPLIMKGDSARIRQILVNLVGNAFKFTEKGWVKISVKREKPIGSGASLIRFEVIDTGIGLNEEEQGKLFRSFSQADSSTTRKYGGTGLGLAISKQLSELMGGAIGVTSSKGAGAAFWFTIVVSEPSEAEATLISRKKMNFSGKTALVIEDDPVFTETLTGILERLKVEVMSVPTGEEARACLAGLKEEKKQPDVVFVDLDLPDYDGMHLVRDLQEESLLQREPAILMTASRCMPSVDEVGACGAVAAMEKPVTSEDIRSVLSRALGDNEPGSTAPAQDIIAESSYGQLRVLVAEDNKVNQMVIKGLLKKLGIKPVVVDNGLEAYESYVSSEPFDLILMDCEMPVVDGWEATRKIRDYQVQNISEKGELLIIALSAHALSIEREKAASVGMDDYLAKPVSRDDLDSMFKKYKLDKV